MKKESLHIENDACLAQWMSGEISDTELNNFVSEEDARAYFDLREGLHIFEALEQPLERSFTAVQNRIRTKESAKVRKLYLRWAASVAAVAIVFFGLFSMLNQGNTVIHTSIAEQKIITLLDGSEVIVNAKSELSFNKKTWEARREVHLTGEAYFKVKKGSTFSVITENGTIDVLGTQFNVNSNQDYFEVNCYEGRVEVSNLEKNYILNPGKAFRRINGNDQEQWNFGNTTPSWIAGESSFKSVPLKYVILSLEKQYNLKFDSTKIDDNLVFTGSFGHNDIEVALASVFRPMQIHYNIRDDVIVLN